jgi:hypothetical protein
VERTTQVAAIPQLPTLPVLPVREPMRPNPSIPAAGQTLDRPAPQKPPTQPIPVPRRRFALPANFSATHPCDVPQDSPGNFSPFSAPVPPAPQVDADRAATSAETGKDSRFGAPRSQYAPHPAAPQQARATAPVLAAPVQATSHNDLPLPAPELPAPADIDAGRTPQSESDGLPTSCSGMPPATAPFTFLHNDGDTFVPINSDGKPFDPLDDTTLPWMQPVVT